MSRAMRQLARAPSQSSTALARDLAREIQRNFDRGVDPYGNRWKPLAASTIARGRRNPPLTNTGRGRASVVVVPLSGAGVRMLIGVAYMMPHQDGAWNKRPPRRQIIPVDKLPATWERIWQRHLDAAVARTLEGRRRG